MADDKPNIEPEIYPTLSGETDKKNLKTGNETVRQRTLRLETKSAKKADNAGKRSLAGAFWWGFTRPVRLLAHAVGKLGRYRFFRIIGRILLPNYLRNSWRELRQVAWPDRSTSWRLTYAVIIFSVLFGSLVAVVDFGLDKLFKELIIK